ncbi:MAG: hypothetical protein GKR98_12665 [Boseongicola sp.]|nr:MAG: hypothetical protein GKR98_12665 [Boseongicola sp.]
MSQTLSEVRPLLAPETPTMDSYYEIFIFLIAALALVFFAQAYFSVELKADNVPLETETAFIENSLSNEFVSDELNDIVSSGKLKCLKSAPMGPIRLI